MVGADRLSLYVSGSLQGEGLMGFLQSSWARLRPNPGFSWGGHEEEAPTLFVEWAFRPPHGTR